MLIDCTYFTKGSRHILNAAMGTIDPHASDVMESVEDCIAAYQEEFLCLMLGDTLGNKMHTYLVCLDEDADCKRNDKFEIVCSRLKESFADYVFFHYLRDNAEQATLNGTVRIKNANDPVPPIRKQVWAWNAMVGRNRRFVTWAHSEECPVSGIRTADSMLTNINTLNL